MLRNTGSTRMQDFRGGQEGYTISGVGASNDSMILYLNLVNWNLNVKSLPSVIITAIIACLTRLVKNSAGVSPENYYILIGA